MLCPTTRPPPRPTLFPYTTLFRSARHRRTGRRTRPRRRCPTSRPGRRPACRRRRGRSEEHTSELQSQSNLVCRLLLEKKMETMGVGDVEVLDALVGVAGHGATDGL